MPTSRHPRPTETRKQIKRARRQAGIAAIKKPINRNIRLGFRCQRQSADQVELAIALTIQSAACRWNMTVMRQRTPQ